MKRYTKMDIWNDLAELKATCIDVNAKNEEIQKIMDKISDTSRWMY